MLVTCRRFRKIAKINITLVMAVRPSVLMKQLGSLWTDFHEVW